MLPTVGPWGWHLPLGLKWSITTAATAAVYFELTDDEQDYWVDMGVVLGWGFTMYGLWAPPVVKMAIMARIGLGVGVFVAPAAPVIAVTAAALVIGDIVSHQIDPKEGRKNFREFVSTPSKYRERTGESLKTVYKYKIKKPLKSAAESYVGWVDRELEALKFISSWGQWANPTPGYRFF